MGPARAGRIDTVTDATRDTSWTDILAPLRRDPGLSSFVGDHAALIVMSGDGREVVRKMADRGVLCGVPVKRLEPGKPELHDLILVANTEINTDEDRAAFVDALKLSI